MRRLVIAALLCVPLACGVVYAPGDFLEPVTGSSTSRTDSGANGETSTSSGGTDGGATADAGPKVIRVALFAGRRDSFNGEPPGTVYVAETLMTSLRVDGTIAPWTYDAPPPSSAWTHGVLLNGLIYVQNAVFVARASFTDHVTSAWSLATIPPAPEIGVRPWMLDDRGVTSGRANAIGSPSTSTAATFFAPFVDGGVNLGPWARTTTTTTVVRGDTTLLRVGELVYAIGGLRGADFSDPEHAVVTYPNAVEVSVRTPNGELGDFTATASLATVDGGVYKVENPVAVAGSDRIFVLGGTTTQSASTRSSVTMAARIADMTTGMLDPFVVLPPFPQPMSSFAAVVTRDWVVVFGGETASKMSDAVLRLAIHADGTYGSQWESAGTLPGGRSSLVAVTY